MLSYIKKEAQTDPPTPTSDVETSDVEAEFSESAISALDERLAIASRSIADGISDGNSEFSSGIGFRFRGLFDMLAHGIDKQDNIEGAFRLSFGRLNASISKVKSKLLPFTRVVSEISKIKNADEKTKILNRLLPGFGSIEELEPGDNETKILEDEYYASSDRIAFFKSRVIPIFNQKWSTVTGVSGDGMSRELYSAIIGWATLGEAMAKMGSSAPSSISPGEIEKPRQIGNDASAPVAGDTSALAGAVIIKIYPDPVSSYAALLMSGGVDIDTDALSAGDPLAVVIEIRVSDVVAGNALEAQDVFYEFIRSNTVTINETVLRSTSTNIERLFTASTSISPDETLLLRIAIDVMSLKDTMPPAGGTALLKVRTEGGQRNVLAKNLLYEKLIKLSSGSATTPLYETIGSDGKAVTFTAAQLVAGGGKIRGAGGKPFRPKKWKGRSLADRVMSKGFGRKK